jgi:hypothetical protein
LESISSIQDYRLILLRNPSQPNYHREHDVGIAGLNAGFSYLAQLEENFIDAAFPGLLILVKCVVYEVPQSTTRFV